MHRGLTSFRALAFLVVFLFHAFYPNAGYIGVQAFFVLSGFLLTPILLDMKEALPRRQFFARFYARRALRVLPLYYSYVLVMAIVAIVWVSSPSYEGITAVELYLDQLPNSLTHTYNFLEASADFEPTPWVTHFWSLAVEEQFYLVWPLALFWVPRERVKTFLGAVLVAGPFLRGAIVLSADMGLGSYMFPSLDLVVYVLPFSHLDAFAMGGFFALYRARDSGPPASVVLVSLVGLMMGLDWLLLDDVPGWENFGMAPFMHDNLKWLWGYTLLNLAFAQLLVLVRDERWMPRLMNTRVMVYLGTISYSLYVVHYVVIWLSARWLLNENRYLIVAVALGASIALASVTYFGIERPFMRMKDRLAPREA